ncbi:hypothetical protein [Absidia glauca]|uniref:Phosphotransferase n=1 Tax=Absidia glauca TaxID=4829 RepID=A0A163M9A0_ABSGL|nr:hypothetical protein [Absidia glauca]
MHLGYYEDLPRIKKEFDSGKTLSDEMVVNMEWGAFDCERRILPLTMHDNKMNRESVNINEQLFEKMISGMYLGEIARNCMLHWIDRLVLFGGQSSPEMNTQWRFETAYMSTIQADRSPRLSATQHVLEDIMDIPAGSTTLADRQMVQLICQAVGRRSARLAACGLAGILTHKDLVAGNDKKDCLIAIDGSLFEFYPDFEKNMMDALVELFGEKMRHRVRFELSRDGSGLGASVIAMMASKTAQQL